MGPARPLLVVALAVARGGSAQEGGAGPEVAAPVSRPNLVLVTIDTLRADHLSCYGYFRRTSPFLDELAADAVVFEQCYATIPHTTPSHASLMTGLLPYEHGIAANSLVEPGEPREGLALVTSAQLRTWAQIVAAHRWSTGGFVSSATTGRVTGLAAGFDAWDEPDDLGRPGIETLGKAIAWLEQTRARPFFLWLHLFDVHGIPDSHRRDALHSATFQDDAALRAHMEESGIPATLPRGNRPPQPVPVAINGYDGAILHADGLVRELVAALERTGAWPTTALVVTSDHGEGLGQHGYMAHALVWREQLHVPLIVRVPGRGAEHRGEPMSGIDVLPTLVDLVRGLPREELLAQASGRSVVAAGFEPRPVFSMSPAGQNEFAVTLSRWKFIHRTKGMDALYDLESDPCERADLLAASPPSKLAQQVSAALGTYLRASITEQRERHIFLCRGGRAPTLTAGEVARHLEALKKLGYSADDAHERTRGD